MNFTNKDLQYKCVKTEPESLANSWPLYGSLKIFNIRFFWEVVECLKIGPAITGKSGSNSRVQHFFFNSCESTFIIKTVFCKKFPSVKFMFSKKAKKIDEIFTDVWQYVVNVKSMVKISSIFVAFLENMNFKTILHFSERFGRNKLFFEFLEIKKNED